MSRNNKIPKFYAKPSSPPDPCTSGNDFVTNLQIGQSKYQFLLSTNYRHNRRSEVCSRTIEDINQRFGTRQEIKLTFQSDNDVLLSHMRRNRIHDNMWLDTFSQYNDDAFKREFGLAQFLIYKSHIEEKGPKFRWGLPQKTFSDREMEQQVKQQAQTYCDYLPADIKVNFCEIDVKCMHNTVNL